MSSRPPVAREIAADGTVLRRLAAAFPDRYPALLDSASRGPLGRWTLLAAQPVAALWADATGTVHGEGVETGPGPFLACLERWWRREHRATPPGGESPVQAPFRGGWVLFLGYETAGEIEPRLRLPPAPLPWRSLALRVPAVLAHDASTGRVHAFAETAGRLQAIEADIAALPPPGPAGGVPAIEVEEEPAERFLERVRRAQDYIRAGDIYQANLSRGWSARLGGGADPVALYERLRERNPAPFAALLQWRGVSLLSSSPERLVQVAGRDVHTRPIAGTRPRSREPGRDAAEIRELVRHPKERAEHVMLIDLERSDLGRVCEAGTVEVNEFMVAETYAHVHHIVSNVRGRLRADVSPVDVVRALFPGGTITGCPKVRCMEIIAGLEQEGRGAYTGSLGWLGLDGDMDLNILIRTMTVHDGRLALRAGAGIVADSDPLRELEETRAKARGLLAVLEGGGAGAGA